MLYDCHIPVCIRYWFEINIIRRAFQIFHPKSGNDILLLSFKNINVDGIRTNNPITLIVDKLNREIYIAVTVMYAFIAVEEFCLD